MEQKGVLTSFGGGFLLLCLLASMEFAFVVMEPFITIFIMALVLAIIARPLYLWLLNRMPGRESLASLLTVLLVVVVFILPCLMLLSILTQEALQAYEMINEKARLVLTDGHLLDKIKALQARFLPQIDMDLGELTKSLAGVAGQVSNYVLKMAGAALGVLSSSLWKAVLMLFVVFYFLKDGRKLADWASHLFPLPSSLEKEIATAFINVSKSAFYGTFLTALAQGILGGIGFWIAGLQPFVWGLVMAFFSMVPLVGTAIVWVPAAVFLILTHKIGWGIFLIAWGVGVVGMSDNFLRPLFMKGKNELHPVLIFFSLLGGIAAFGFLGILLGPLAIVLFISLLKAYEEAARPILDDLDNK